MSAHCKLKRIVPVVLALVFCFGQGTGAAEARDVTGNWGVGVEGGLMKLVGGQVDYSNVDQIWGLNLDRGLAKGWELQVGYKYGYLRPGVETRSLAAGWTFISGGPYYTMISQPSVNLLRNFLPERTLSPKVGLGLGLTSWKVLNLRNKDVGLFPSGDPTEGFDNEGNRTALEGTDLTFTLEAGVDAFLMENLALNLGTRLHWTPTNNTDNVGASNYWGSGAVDANIGRIDLYLGMTWWFGSRDSDHDGILNEFDKCPDLPEDMDGFQDLDGCPDLDNDGDRIPDERDNCPDNPEDYDGYQDTDGCPEPDNDGDGIFDGLDGCPDEAEDMDGFQDQDGCPDLDNDEDGVLDELDMCPDTPDGTTVDQEGCPVAAAIKQSLILEGVVFISGSARLAPESLQSLSKVAESLLAWPNVKIEIRGHTDSTGSPETNRDLSHRRALAVKDSLVHLGVDPSRLSAVGYGEDYPLADNATPEGRKVNRRVEIHKVN